MKRAADSLSKAPPHSFHNSTRLVGGSKNTLHRDDRGKVQVILSGRNGDLSEREDNGSRRGIGFFTVQLLNKDSQHSCATLALHSDDELR